MTPQPLQFPLQALESGFRLKQVLLAGGFVIAGVRQRNAAQSLTFDFSDFSLGSDGFALRDPSTNLFIHILDESVWP